MDFHLGFHFDEKVLHEINRSLCSSSGYSFCTKEREKDGGYIRGKSVRLNIEKSCYIYANAAVLERFIVFKR